MNRTGRGLPGLTLRAALVVAPAWPCAAPALAHDGRPHSPGELWYTWGLDPFVILSLALSGILYYAGVRRLWRESAGGGIRRWEAAAYASGWLALWVALVSPLHPLGEVLFSAHMTQHELLMLVAAPLLVLGRPLIPYLWALPLPWRRRLGRAGKSAPVQAVWRTLTQPIAAWAVHAVALWIWHVPSLFEATIDNDLVHTLQHSSFLFSALLFWWALVHCRRGLAGYGAAVLYVFTTAMHSGILGALLTFAQRVWYPIYSGTTASWGLSPIEDQQLGGLIMWIPAGVVYLIAGLALFAGWMRQAESSVDLWPLGASAERPEIDKP
jgi:putative membrane protein